MKNIKRLLVVGLAITTVVTSTLFVPANGEAKVKLSKKSLKLYTGQTAKLKVKGTKKKVKWSTSNKKVATVKKGTVKAVAPGSAKITAKVGKKKYKCNVKVNPVVAVVTPAPKPIVTPAPVVDPQQQLLINNALAQNITARADKLASGDVLYTVINNNAQAIPTIKLSIMLCDANGAPVDTDTVTIEDLLPGETAYDLYPYSSKANQIDTSKSQVNVNVTQNSSHTKWVTPNVSVAGAKNTDNKMVMTYINNTVQSVYLRGYIFYKDASGAILAADSIYNSITPGATKYETLSRPYYHFDSIDHEAYDDINYESASWVYRAYYY